MKINDADTKITLLEERVKRMVAGAENEERETKETLLARQREEQLKFERQQLEQKAEFERKRLPLRVNRMSNFRSLSSQSTMEPLRTGWPFGTNLRWRLTRRVCLWSRNSPI